jgi:uncharacterized repeat protein (TIGR01451 family)
MRLHLLRRASRTTLVLAIIVASFAVVPGSPAGAEDAPDGSRSTITQQLVDREPLAGGGWRLTIEATLDSNAVCHVGLFQCVVEPELSPPNLTLESVECLSADWHRIEITLPIVGTVVDVCARFDAERAGRDQRFRFTYVTPLDVGTVSEKVRFFRFPEEFFFTRAQNTITVDLSAEADVSEVCPDRAAIGQPVECTVRVEALSNVPDASVARTAPAQFANATLVPDVDTGDWDCSTLVTCEYTANSGTLPIGVYTFTAGADVVAPPADVQDCEAVATAGTTIGSTCADVRVFEDDTDTDLDIEMTATTTEAVPGDALTFPIVVTNTGSNVADGVRVFETPPALLENTTISFLSGAGTWVCSTGATLQCTAPTLPVGATATFLESGTVSASAQNGDAIANEIAAEWVNDPFGPDVPVRDGVLVRVVAAVPVVIVPRFTG